MRETDLKQIMQIHGDMGLAYIKGFDEEWSAAVKRLKRSGRNLDIPILPVGVTYKQRKSKKKQ